LGPLGQSLTRWRQRAVKERNELSIEVGRTGAHVG
jgi:hypothetical protein